MTGLTMVGISHHGASLALLERVTVRRDARQDLLMALRSAGSCEAVLLSTCSRVEIYVDNTSLGMTDLFCALVAHSRVTHDELKAVIEVRTGRVAREHLFDVTEGLKSRVRDEVEILAQTRVAYRESQAAGITGRALAQLFPAALRSGRKIRATTALDGLVRSLGHQAVEIGLASLATCADPRVIVVGSGQMATSAVNHLAGLGIRVTVLAGLGIRVTVAARDEAYAARLAGAGAVCALSALTRGIAQTDLVICATTAAQPVVTMDHVSGAMAERTSPLTVVDLSVPRNVDPAVAQVPGVTLIDLVGLNDDGTAEPGVAAALSLAAMMSNAAVADFTVREAAREAGPVIEAMRYRVKLACEAELAEFADWHTLDADARARSVHAIAGKLLHGPTMAARHAAAVGDSDGLRRLCTTFGVPLAEVGLAETTLTGPGKDAVRIGFHPAASR
jgi:glutamyl-tRNA reductase